MNVFEIDRQLLELIDQETGEIADIEAFEALQMSRDEKIRNMIKYEKNLLATADGIAEEISKMRERKEKMVARAERLREYIGRVLDGAKYTAAEGEVSYRKSKAVVTDDEFVAWAADNAQDLLKLKTTATADKDAIKKAIEAGETIEHASVVERMNTIIK